jgi:hypothetical protein
MPVDINAVLGERNAERSMQFSAGKNALSDVLFKEAWMLYTVYRYCSQQEEGECGADAVHDVLFLVERNAVQVILFLVKGNGTCILFLTIGMLDCDTMFQ